MEAQEDRALMGSKEYAQIVIKRKRTKRQRQPSPLALTIASTSSSAGGGRESENSGGVDFPAIASPNDYTDGVEEEEDMANCLILLARGVIGRQRVESTQPAASFIYHCKTCYRSFPSFQALGGHRASHRRPKEEKKTTPPPLTNKEDNSKLQIEQFSIVKIHECSICSAEFSSGQALGGHMRRHRQSAAPVSLRRMDESVTKQRDVLGLDLNLPAPEDNYGEDSACDLFPSKGKALVFPASLPLLNCSF